MFLGKNSYQSIPKNIKIFSIYFPHIFIVYYMNYLNSINMIKSKDLNLSLEFAQSNVEGELVNLIQDAREIYDGMIINAAGFTHTSVAIRDALNIFKKP